jgi:hypothetical protein
LIKMGAGPQTPGIYRFSASMTHAGRSDRPSHHARTCSDAQVPSLESLVLRAGPFSVEARSHMKPINEAVPALKKT